jgi:hypothetical protein
MGNAAMRWWMGDRWVGLEKAGELFPVRPAEVARRAMFARNYVYTDWLHAEPDKRWSPRVNHQRKVGNRRHYPRNLNAIRSRAQATWNIAELGVVAATWKGHRSRLQSPMSQKKRSDCGWYKIRECEEKVIGDRLVVQNARV